jgi:hypothetical protein
VPAKVGGTWQLKDGELTLKQTFQRISGTLKSAAGTAKIANAKLNGDQISFSVGRTRYSGQVSGNEMRGTTNGGGSWRANRTSK